MTGPEHLNRIRATNYRRAWIGCGAVLLVCSAFSYWVVLDAEAVQQAAARRSRPGVTICFFRDPLTEAKLWVCGITATVSVGILVRGLMIRLPAA
jgi:hypothetical protein